MTWNEVLMYIIETVLKLLVVAVIPYLANLVRVRIKNDTQEKYLNLFEQMIKDAVDQVQQTYVTDMKAENLFDKDAQKHAIYLVRDTVFAMMNQRMQEIVLEAVGDIDEYIRNKIEAEVFRIKETESANVSK